MRATLGASENPSGLRRSRFAKKVTLGTTIPPGGRLKNPLDSDLSIGQRYPAFERPGTADVCRLNTGIQGQLHRCQLSRRNSIRLVSLLRSGVIMQPPVVQKLDSAIHRIPVRETNCAIQWIVRIYSVDSVIHLLNNWDQEYGISCVNRKVVV